MRTFEYSSRITMPPAVVFKWHTRSGAFERLSPPWMDVHVVERLGGVVNGGRVTLQLRKGPLRLRWQLEHRDIIEGSQFVDEQVTGPFRRWRHTHRFEPDAADGCVVRDHIEYELPAGRAGESLAGRSVEQMLVQLFQYRHEQLQQDLERHRLAESWRPQRIVISGASGLIGSALSHFLSSGGHRVDRLARGMPRPGSTDIHWEPAKGKIDAAGLDGADVVVHLAGENLIGRWTEPKRQAILHSRVDSTRLLAETLARLGRPPRVFVCASATGYYGDRAAEPLTEESKPGGNFLAEVCQAWEAAAERARQAGIRTVHARIGVVLSGQGGALRAMLRPFQLGLGGSLGSGYQYVSWIDIDDLLGAMHFAIFTDPMAGPINMVSPHSMIQRDLAREIGRVLHRPTALNMPGPLLRALLGEMADNTLLSSQRVVPARLASAGFTFYRPQLADCLARQLGRTRKVSTRQAGERGASAGAESG